MVDQSGAQEEGRRLRTSVSSESDGDETATSAITGQRLGGATSTSEIPSAFNIQALRERKRAPYSSTGEGGASLQTTVEDDDVKPVGMTTSTAGTVTSGEPAILDNGKGKQRATEQEIAADEERKDQPANSSNDGQNSFTCHIWWVAKSRIIRQYTRGITWLTHFDRLSVLKRRPLMIALSLDAGKFVLHKPYVRRMHATD